MTVDIPRAWEIARSKPREKHHQKCSYRTYGLLCDCWVLKSHQDYIDDEMQTACAHENNDELSFQHSEIIKLLQREPAPTGPQLFLTTPAYSGPLSSYRTITSGTHDMSKTSAWVINVAGGYGAFIFNGSEDEAKEMRAHKANWEQAIALMRPADADEIKTGKPSQCWNHKNFKHFEKGINYSCDCGNCNQQKPRED